MQFMIIVKATADSEAGVMPDVELLTAMGKFNEEMVNAGVLVAGEGLYPSSKGVRIRFETGGVDEPRRTVIEGPFEPVKELIAGFWLIDVKSKEEAIQWMKRAQFDRGTEIEIRPVFDSSDFDAMTPELLQQEAELRAKTAARST